MRFADTDTQAAYNRAAMFEDTQTARRFLAGYENTSLPLEIYGQAFQSAYQAGQNSRAMTEYERKVGFGTMLEDGVYRIAYQAGQEATAAQNARLESTGEPGQDGCRSSWGSCRGRTRKGTRGWCTRRKPPGPQKPRR